MSSGCIPGDPPLPSQATLHSRRNRQVLAEQVRLLYANAGTGLVVTILVASVLGYLQWPIISHSTVLGWLAFMHTVTFSRYGLTRYYQHNSADSSTEWFRYAFTIG